MASLRDNMFTAPEAPVTQGFKDQLESSGMGEIGKGWASGRLGNEINTLRSQEASLRADNDVKGGDALNARVQTLKQRQGLYAPEVGKVEDIDGFVKAASWLGGQVGQGVASSIDQVATGTALGGAATLAGLIPHRGAQALSKGLRLAAPTAMYAQNVPLMKGENYDAMTQDPAIMANHTPQELNSMARNSGMAGALLDTAVPGYMAHGLSGGGLKKGLRAMNPLQHAAVEMGVEGLNETGQEMIKNRALTELNANRDTSGDNSAYLNSFAGGAAGSSHMALGSSLADAGFRRVGDTAEKFGTKMGEGFDLAADAASPVMKRGKDAVTDLMSDEDGKVSAAALMDNLKAGAQDMKSSAQSKLDEHSILTGAMPDELMADETPAGMAKLGAWLAQNDTKRAALVVDKLEGMEQDPVALQHLDALDAAAQDPDQYNQAVGAAAEYVLEQTSMGRAQSRADTFGENMGKLASVVGPAVGRGVVATGRAALKFGKSVLSGAQEGLAKKNMQADETSANPRAELAGGYAADMAQRSAPQNKNLAGLARHLAFSLADMIDSTDTGGAKVMDKAGIDARVTRLNRIVSDFHDIYKKNAPEVLRQLGSILGPNSGEAVTHMLSELEQRTAPGGQRRFVESRDALAQQVVGLVDPAAQVKLMSEGVNLNTPKGREQLLGLMEDYADGIGSGPGARQALDQHFGKESVQSILTLLNGQEEKEKVGSVVDDRQTTTTESVDPNADDETGGTDFDQRTAEKTAAKGAGPKVYGFHATKNLRTNSQNHDPFGLTKKTEPGEIATRPKLFIKGQQLFGGKGSAVEKKIADIKAQLQEDPNYPDHDNYDVREVSALQAMKDMNMQPTKMLQLHRDYLIMDGNTEDAARVGSLLTQLVRIRKGTDGAQTKSTPAARQQRKERAQAWSAVNPGKTVQDYKDELAAEKMTALEGPLAAATKAAQDYFGAYSVVVGEQLSNRDPSKMAVTEMLDMNKEGQGMIERSRGKTVGGVFTAYPLDVQREKLNDANILMFKGKDGEVAIPAGKLVNWVRKQRGMSEATDAEDTDKNFSNGSKDEAYLNDVMEGVATLIGTGQVTGMPYKINLLGKAEQFSQGIPESLRLATKTYGAMKHGEGERREGRARRTDESLATVGTEAYEEKVAIDQDKQAEFFSPDDRELREPSVDVRGQKSQDEKPPLVTRTRGDLGLGEDGRKANGPIRVDISGQTATEAKTDASDKTELDFSKKPKDGVPDEYANQRWLSRQTGASTDASIGPEPKGTAASSAKFRASQIAEAFLRNPAEGQEMIRSRIRSARRPEYTENKPAFGKLTVPGVAGKDQVVGGVHYIAPVAAFINASELAKANVDLSAATIKAIQSKVANILIKGDVSKAEQVKIARLMLDGVEKVTSMNVNAVLGRYAESTAVKSSPVVAKQEAAPEVAKAGLPKGQLTLSGGRKLNAMVAGHQWMYHGTRAADEALIQPDGSLLLKPSKNLGGKTFGVSFTHDVDSAKDYATRIKGGGPKGFTFKGAKVLKIDRAALMNIEEETFGEWADYSGKDVVIPKGSFAIEPVARDKALLSDSYLWRGGDYSFTDYVKDNYSGHGEDAAYQDDMTKEEYLDMIVDPDSGSSAEDVREASAILRDEFGRDQRLNAQDPSSNARAATQADMDAAKAYALKVLGSKIQVEFKDITGYSGEFIDAKNIIEISTTAAAGTLGTLYHEAMHVFFRDFVKGNPRVIATFESLINDPKHLAKLTALLDGYPAAQAQLHGAGSGEERLSYTYQFWKAGLLQVDAKASTWLQKIGKFFRRVLGHVRDSERALELFQAFDNGKMSEPSAAGQVIAAAMGKGGNAMKFRRQFDGVMQGVAALTMPAGEILAKSVSPTARRLSTMMFTNPGEEAHGQEETGLMNARRNVSQQYINITNRKFETMSSVDQNAVQKYLQIAADLHDIPNADHRAAVKDVRAVLDRFHQYMTDAGMKIGKVEKYYPTVWSAAALNDKKAEFIKMLVTKYPQQMNPNGGNAQKSAERIWRSLVDKEGVDAHLPAGREDGVLSPFFASQEMRTLPWLEGADKEKFLEKNMPLTLTRYFSQGAHATEYFRRFGENGKRLEVMLGSINKELSTAGREMMARGEIKDEDARVKWVSRQMRDVSQSVGAMEGSLGKDVSPNMRKFNSWMAVYQNIRVLPMALFSSFVDPLALVARGAPLQAAYETFVYGMREVFRGWADVFKDMPPERAKDEWRQLAEHIGASEIAMFQHHVADEYASAYMSSGAKKINDKMFVLNGMEAWNRGSRIMATKWAVRFLEKHAGLPDKNHSERWLAELGLKPSMITLDEGKLVTDRHALAALKGISLEQATKEIAPIHDALNRWVEGAVLTPNAAQRPAWSSDPNWATLFHLKQFSYSFHQTILKRAVNEFKHGNMAPVGALAAFIPTMITADIMKGLIQGGGSLPPYMASMNAGDWFTHGVQRAGLTGIGVIGMDAANDWSSLGGPAFEQIVDAARDGFGSKSALHAMPLNSLYGRMLAGSAAAPLTT